MFFPSLLKQHTPSSQNIPKSATSLLKITYSRRSPHYFDVYIRTTTGYEFYKTCGHRSDYIRELGFENPDLNAFIRMRVEGMF